MSSAFRRRLLQSPIVRPPRVTRDVPPLPLVRRRDDSNSAQGMRPKAPAPGVIIAERYELAEPLGEGGIASVWRAHDRLLDCVCAIKDHTADPEHLMRFEREARVVARLRSPNVVSIFDRGHSGGLFYIAMEYLEGEDLRTRLDREAKLEPRHVYALVAQVAHGLALAHAHGVVHRDIKPENVFLVADGAEEIVKIVDFGIAKQQAARPAELSTLAGEFLGTPHYASPEQLRGLAVDWRSDLWSLAVLTLECLTGKCPFASESFGDLCAEILYDPLPFEINPSLLPPALADFFRCALERDPTHRFQSAHEFADALAVALGCARPAFPSLAPRAELTSVTDDASATVRRRSAGLWWMLLAAVGSLVASFVVAPDILAALSRWYMVRNEVRRPAVLDNKVVLDARSLHPGPEVVPFTRLPQRDGGFAAKPALAVTCQQTPVRLERRAPPDRSQRPWKLDPGF